MMKLLITLFFLITAARTFAEDTRPLYLPRERDKLSTNETVVNFGAVYSVQWLYYLTDQKVQIREHGSFENWIQYPLRPHFDKDSFDYNIFKHSITGSYYYHWYRSRGYDERRAFMWSFISSLTFEFTIETITERPSYQDIYQTPVFGAVLGIGVEKAARYFHSLDTWYGHTLGYILNPFNLIPRIKEQEQVTAAPLIDKDKVGVYASYTF